MCIYIYIFNLNLYIYTYYVIWSQAFLGVFFSSCYHQSLQNIQILRSRQIGSSANPCCAHLQIGPPPGLWERKPARLPGIGQASIVSYLDTSTIIWASVFEIRLTFFKYANHLIWRKKPIWNKVLSFFSARSLLSFWNTINFWWVFFCLRCLVSTVLVSSFFSVRCKERSALSVNLWPNCAPSPLWLVQKAYS